DCASAYDIPVILQHDHTMKEEICKEAVDAGLRSIMFDGSALPFEENIRRTKAVVDLVHSYNGWVEAELGSIPGLEDEVFSAETVYTQPDQAVEFIKRTGCDSLSVA